jgi:dihydroorotase
VEDAVSGPVTFRLPHPRILSPMPRLLIRNGHVIDPVSGLDAIRDVAIQDGQIVAIRKRLSATSADVEVNADSCLVVPGLIDPHVHFREPGGEHKETLATGSRAAIAGGFATVCCMPNTNPPLDTPDMLTTVLDRAARSASCRIFPVAAATKGRKGEEVSEIELMAVSGAVGFSDDGDCVASAGVMVRVLTIVRRTGLAFMQHCQDPTLTRGAVMHAGTVAVRMGLTGWARVAEEIIIERDLRLNRAIGCRYHVQHISSGESVDLVRKARQRGERVTAEATPHHLILTDEACDGYETMAKVNPPLRERSDMEAIREGIADGTITILGTDHAPHSADEKALPFEEAPFGMIGLETALPLYAEALVHSGAIRWAHLIRLMTIEPARLCGLDTLGLGMLAEGGPADVTIIDPEMRWTVHPSDLRGRSHNTPFMGRAMHGRAIITIVDGRLVWNFDEGRVKRRSAAMGVH